MTNSRIKRTLTAIIFASLCLLLLPERARAAIGVSGIFSDHMVVQAGEPIQIWGTAKPGELIGVQLAGKKGLATTNPKGRWKTTIPAVAAGGPYELLVVGGSEEIVIHDVMAGEVWICSGQSNMSMTLAHADLDAAQRAVPADSSVRTITIDKNVAEVPTRAVKNTWQVLDKDNARNCAAVPYFFALELRKKISSPVGLVIAAAPGSTVQSWISEKGLAECRQGRTPLSERDEQFKRYKEYQQVAAEKKKNSKEEQTLSKEDMEIGSWSDDAEQAKKYGKTAPFIPPAASLFDGMIWPIAPYTAKGILWYQGETNISESSQYEELFTSLIGDWRRAWNKVHMPFLYVQLPPIGERQPLPSGQSAIAVLRDEQLKASLLPWTYMASAVDSINQDTADWHASNKKLIGRRLAQIALSTQYNQPGAFKGPSLESIVVEGNRARVRFKNASHGLTARGSDPTGFAIAGDDKKFLWAKAEIDGDSVVVWHDAVKQPFAVTYGWADNPNGNLYNGDNLPAIPFKRNVSNPIH